MSEGIGTSNNVPFQVVPVDKTGQQFDLRRGLNIPIFDYCNQTVLANVVTWTYKVGGSEGTVVAEVVIEYTNESLHTIQTITRTI